MRFARIPRHVSFIPDGNRRWADERGLARGAGYAQGIERGINLLELCRDLGIEEVSIYGFTKENVRRPSDQVEAFRDACTEFGIRAVDAGAALRAVGDVDSAMFPPGLRMYAESRSDGDLRVNLLVNYSWQWDLFSAMQHARTNGGVTYTGVPKALATGDVPRVDLVVRWGGRRRLSGFLPVQCAYADFYVIDTLWPDSQPEEFLNALEWYQVQDVTMGG
ncbi:MAG: di-trans,poly-cis-decaprenylcistransferase [Gammaproteobacteria bacterium]|nr:di-trans,poly-cis-decaprenylcistransferase [Gammaproteobacteria bacterium]